VGHWAKIMSVYILIAHLFSHRHVRYGLFFHSLALIGCLRAGNPSDDVRRRYLEQVRLNQKYISRCRRSLLSLGRNLHLLRWRSPSPVNTSTWVALVDAELASLTDNPDAFKLYDAAVRFIFSPFTMSSFL
jgi:hypothetical protein